MCSLKNKNLLFSTADVTFISEYLFQKYQHVLHGNANLSNQFGKNALHLQPS